MKREFILVSHGRYEHLNGSSSNERPQVFALAQNYPNPFNPTTRFDYALASDSHVKLSIINTLGQTVAKLVNEDQSAGYKSIEFDASKLPSGVYFYQLQAGSFSDIKKMMLIK